MKKIVLFGLLITLGLTGCSGTGLDISINTDAVKSAVTSGVDTAKNKITKGYKDLEDAKNEVTDLVSGFRTSGGLSEESIERVIKKALDGTGVEDNVSVKLTGKNYEVTVKDEAGNTLVSMKLAKDSDLLTKEGRAEITRKIKGFVEDTYNALFSDWV